MGPLNLNQALGNIVEMNRTNPGHLDSQGKAGLAIDAEGFGNKVADAIGRVSERELAADEIFERMITHPDEVDVHDVTIAMARAEMSLTLTKAIVDRAVKAYNDITAMR